MKYECGLLISPVMFEWSPLKKLMRKENASDSLKTGSSHIWRLQANSINMERNTISSLFKPYSGQIAIAEYQDILYSFLVSPILPKYYLEEIGSTFW